jgi:hypothetical protein
MRKSQLAGWLEAIKVNKSSITLPLQGACGQAIALCSISCFYWLFSI